MMLAAAWNENQCELRADLQRYYGIDIDHAMRGEHTAAHVAALVKCLPTDCMLFAARDVDASWSREQIILAEVRNILNDLAWGMSDPKKRGKRPERIGPSWMTRGNMRTLESRVLTIDELVAELNKPRRKTKEAS